MALFNRIFQCIVTLLSQTTETTSALAFQTRQRRRAVTIGYGNLSRWQRSRVPFAKRVETHRVWHWSTREKSFLKTKATLLRGRVFCLQRDQSYVVGGVYIRGSMELRASARLRFGILPSVRCQASLSCSPSLAFLLHRPTHVRASVQSFSPGRSVELFPQRHIPLTHTHAFAARC